MQFVSWQQNNIWYRTANCRQYHLLGTYYADMLALSQYVSKMFHLCSTTCAN